MIERNINLVRKIVWSYVKTNEGLEFDDLFSEACLAVLENQHRYNPEKGKKTTFTYHVVTNHLNNLLKRKVENPVDNEVIEDLLTDNEPSPEQAIIAQERWEETHKSLSPEAQMIYEILADGNLYLPIDKPKKCKGIIIEHLRQMGWSWSQIWNSFSELKMTANQS